jgi:anti-sigma factor RsiW
MNNHEAKFRLQAYRPGGQDAGDAAFCEALAQAERDPALRSWFAREQAFDATVTAKVGAIVPPAGLREAILAGGRVTPRRAGWFPPAWWWAIAAVIVVVFTFNAVWRSRSETVPLDSFSRFAIDDLRLGHHGGHGAAEGALETTLTNPATHLAGVLPIDFTKLEATGCRTLHFAGRDVLEVCFHRAGAEFHFYILPRGTLRGADGPHTLELGGVSALAWNDARYVYAVIGQTGADTLRHLL